MARRRPFETRTEVCRPIARSLVEFGYPDVTPAIVKEVLDAWLDGKRSSDLPHGVVGLFVERQIDEVEEEKPGIFAQLQNV